MKDVSMKKWVLHRHIVASNSVSHQNVQWNFWEAVDHFGKSCVKKSFEIGQPFWWKFEFFLRPPWLTFARKKHGFSPTASTNLCNDIRENRWPLWKYYGNYAARLVRPSAVWKKKIWLTVMIDIFGRKLNKLLGHCGEKVTLLPKWAAQKTSRAKNR